MENSFKYLKTVPYSKFLVWDVKMQFLESLEFAYPIVQLNEILGKADITWETIEGDKSYPILGVRGQGQGVYINRVAIGKELTMKKYQKSKAYHFFYCKVRTVGGQMGVVYPEFENSYGSSNMQYWTIDLNKILPEYLELLLKLKRITDIWDKNAIGADGRHFNQGVLLSLEIPLPQISEQNRLVENYNKKIKLAEEQEIKAIEIEDEIETYIFNSLGLSKLDVRANVSGLQLIKFKNLDRWDVLTKDLRIINGLETSLYPLKKLGEVFSFPPKSWNKREFKEDAFNYIELGAIDEVFGVTQVKHIAIKDAPSRATQQVSTGDLIIGTTRPYLKRFAIITKENDGDICSSGFTIIEPSSNYDLNFLKEFLFSYYGIEQLKNRMTGGSYPAITSTELKEILIPFPDVSVQKVIGRTIFLMKKEIGELKLQAEQNRATAIKDFEQEIFKS